MTIVKESQEFWNPNKLMSLKDINRKDPEFYFTQGNRTGGKTFAAKCMFLRKFITKGEKFAIIVRRVQDVPGVADAFFADIGPIKFKRCKFEQKPYLKVFGALYFNGQHCGYVIPIYSAGAVKTKSSKFAEVKWLFFDEFQDEDGKYLLREFDKLQTIRMSLGRGGDNGVNSRPLPVLFVSNLVSKFNPYYIALGIEKNLQRNTHYLRGNGWVLEQYYNETAAKSLKENFATAGKLLDYAADNDWLKDSNKFVSTMPGQKHPLFRIRYEGKEYSVWKCTSEFGGIYVSNTLKTEYPLCFSLTNDDHAEGCLMIGTTHVVMKMLKRAYATTNIRFESQGCKNAVLSALQLLEA